MRPSRAALTALALLIAATPAFAEATEDGANHLEEVFQKYLGDAEGVVSVEADGDNYNVTFDVTPLADKAKMDGSKFEMSKLEFTLHDNGGGKWQVAKEGPLTILVDVPGALHLEGGSDDYTVTGVFDEALATFSTATAEAKKFALKEEFTDPKKGNTVKVDYDAEGTKSTSTAVANASGGIDFDAKIDMGTLTEKFETSADPAAGTPPMNFLLAAQSGTMDIKATGVRNKSVLDLVAFFVSHHDKESITKDQSDLKKIISAALPVWNTMSGTSDVKAVKVTSPFGEFSMDAMTAALDANGAVKDGKFQEKFSLTGLSLPASLVPPWAAPLVPKTVKFDVTASGFDLADPASMILASFDLSTPEGLPADFEKLLVPALLPKGTASITFNQTGLANDIYNLKADATLDVGPAAQPTGKAKISMKGLDEIMKAVQAAPPEAGLQDASAVIIVAKGLAKTESDGTMTWNVESTPDGKIMVNGTDVNTIGKK